MITWITQAGQLAKLTERQLTNINLQATSDVGSVTFELIAGKLPRGLKLIDGVITGSAVEIRKYTESRFVIRARDSEDLEDRTFSIGVDGADDPEWITPEGFLQVGEGEAYFVLDNSPINFQLSATDTDIIAGDVLEYFLVPMAGSLPPGLSLSTSGVISGFTDPIFALEYEGNPSGGYDTGPLDVAPLDFIEAQSNGFDTYYYDDQTYDYNEPSRIPKRLSRIYNFVVGVTDGRVSVNRLFKIYVVTEEFLKADNSLVQVDTNVFQADSTSDRKPVWITDSNLGRYRANNYVTIFLDVYDPPTLSGTITYFKLPTNPGQYQLKSTGEITDDGLWELSKLYPYFPKSNYTSRDPNEWIVLRKETESVLPPGLTLDQNTGEIAGRVPYQAAVSNKYTFTLEAVNFPATLSNISYNLVGDWDSYTGYAVNDAVRYLGYIYVATVANRSRIPSSNPDYWFKGVSTQKKTFNITTIGEIESSIQWVSPSNLGTIKPNQPSRLFVEAKNLVNQGKVFYEFVSGSLPPGLRFLPTGDIDGKVKQFADDTGPGLTRFFDKDSSLIDSTLSRTYTTTFDSGLTTFDKKFSFVARASDTSKFIEVEQPFYITVIADNTKTFSNISVKAFQSKEKRLEWYNLITDANIFKSSDIYRYGDTNFGIQTEIKMLLFAGIESTKAINYVQAMSRNHYRKRMLFGEVKSAQAKDPITQEVVYEVVYVEIVDNLEKNGKSISQTVNLPDNINSKVIVSYDAIKVDSDIPFASDRDHQRIFPNSIKNMRSQIGAVGDRDREFLPLWMRSIQGQATYELGYTKAMVLCYAKPGKAVDIISRIKAKTTFASRGSWTNINNYTINDSVEYNGDYFTCIKNNSNVIPDRNSEFWSKNFNFKNIDFVSDRYIIDIIDGQIEDKYLAFPQRGEKLP